MDALSCPQADGRQGSPGRDVKSDGSDFRVERSSTACQGDGVSAVVDKRVLDEIRPDPPLLDESAVVLAEKNDFTPLQTEEDLVSGGSRRGDLVLALGYPVIGNRITSRSDGDSVFRDLNEEIVESGSEKRNHVALERWQLCLFNFEVVVISFA